MAGSEPMDMDMETEVEMDAVDRSRNDPSDANRYGYEEAGNHTLRQEQSAFNRQRSMSGDDERSRRASIKAILADESITPTERRRSIQHLMDGRRSSIGASSVASSNTSYTHPGPFEVDDAGYGYAPDAPQRTFVQQQGQPFYSDQPFFPYEGGQCIPVSNENTKRAEQTRPQCTHYERNCTMIAPCCGAAFGCRICHDDSPVLPPLLMVKQARNRYPRSSSMPGSFTAANMPGGMENPDNAHHTIDRFAVKEIICRECFTKQSSKTNNCISCGVKFGDYHCNICNLWMSNGEAPYHCDKCSFCRVGGRENFQHCDDCGMCIDKSLYMNHNCKSGKYKSNCPVCQEFLFSSRSASHEMPCGHAIHWECFRQLAAHDSRCLSQNMQVLSSDGFIGYDELRDEFNADGTAKPNGRIATGNLTIADYNPIAEQIVYESPNKFIDNEPNEQTVYDISSAGEKNQSNGISLQVTGNHDLYVRFFAVGEIFDGECNASRAHMADPFEKVQVADILEKIAASDSKVSMEFLNRVTNGAKSIRGQCAPSLDSLEGSFESKSIEKLPKWVWTLERDAARRIVDSIRFAEGENKAIQTSSECYRDELVRLALHAGYSSTVVHERINEQDCWSITFCEGEQATYPTVPISQVKEIEYSGRTWCLNMPHGFLITRCAHRSTEGDVTGVSSPVVIGNCPVCKKTAETRDRMMPTWNAMAAGVEMQTVPPELARVVNITCNDCEKSDDARAWHFLGVQCRSCSSFNTVVDRIIMSGEEAHEFLETLQTRSDLVENEDGSQRINRRRINRRRSLF